LEALEKILDDTTKHAKISDFNQLDDDFEKLKNEVAKQSATFTGETLPKRVLKVFMMVEDCINDVSAADKKTMKKPNLTSYNKLKQKFKKYLEAEGEQEKYQAQVTKYRENPVNSEDEAAEKEKKEKKDKKVVKEEEKEESDEEEDEEEE